MEVEKSDYLFLSVCKKDTRNIQQKNKRDKKVFFNEIRVVNIEFYWRKNGQVSHVSHVKIGL